MHHLYVVVICAKHYGSYSVADVFLMPLLHTPVSTDAGKGDAPVVCEITPTRHVQGKQGVCEYTLPQEVCFCHVLDKTPLITVQQKQPRTDRAGNEEGENVQAG